MNNLLWQQLQTQIDNQRLAHALLWQNVNENNEAQIYLFAQSLLCFSAQNLNPCGHCKSCQLLAAKTHPDYLTFEDESQTINIDFIRAINDFCTQTPQCSDKKIIIIPQAQRMNQNASNALLKTLEEPAGNSFFFLTTNVSSALPATIRSRCQTLRLSLVQSPAPSWQQTFFDDCELLVNKKLDPLQMAQKWQKEKLLDVLAQMEIFFISKQSFDYYEKIINLRKIAINHNTINSQLQLEALLTFS